MASGYSWGGGRSRCFFYWQQFQRCYAQSGDPSECRLPCNDYLECLHHPKEMKRTQAVQEEYMRQIEEAKKGRKERHEAVLNSAKGPAGVEPMKDEPDVAK